MSKENTQKKKMALPLKIVIIVLAVVIGLALILGIAGLVVINRATTDNMPENTTTPSDMTVFIAESALEILSQDKITVTGGDMDLVLSKVMESANNSLPEDYQISELFCVLAEDKGTIYARIAVKKVTLGGITLNLDTVLPVSAHFDVSMQDANLVLNLEEIKCGEITIPNSIIKAATSSVTLPEGIAMQGTEIYYDISGLDAKLDAAITDAIKNSVGDSLGGLLSGLVSDATDVQLQSADIVGDELIIEGSLF